MVIKLPFVSKVLKFLYHYQNSSMKAEYAGMVLPNPLGLAAGFDKNAEIVDQLADIGFGFVEIGTVTPLPQKGNSKPRLFRLPKDKALINRMGFNNAGVEKIRENLLRSRRRCIIGGNIGKNKETPNKLAVKDYEICFNRLYNVVDYFVVNVSSPNTPGLRELQDKDALTEILQRLQLINQSKSGSKPIFLKIAPDLSDEQLNDIINVVKMTQISGIIATNTTIGRENLVSDDKKINKIGEGGLSGYPLKEKATRVIRILNEKSDSKILIIGVGGIYTSSDAIAKLNAGASLLQIYTGFIYEGPGIINKILKGLEKEKAPL
jgi:dihydroorotate dehydrogenase